MKKRIIIPIIVIVLLSCLFFYVHNNLKGPFYLRGLIISEDTNSFKIMNDNDTIYTINGTIISNVGDYVSIKYYGNLDYLQNNKILIKSVEPTNNSYDNNIMRYVDSLSVEEKIGQLIISKIPKENKLDPIVKNHVSGLIYYGNDIGKKTIEQIQNEINNYQKKSKIPLFIAIDEEGGTVSRLSYNKNISQEIFLSPQELYNNGGFEEITKDAIRKRDLLVKLGFNVNYAPVIDVVTDESAYMYQRSFGKDAKETAKFALTILNTQTKELTYTLKHFPGYGNNKDTHLMQSTDERTLSYFDENDFIPYVEAINNGAKQVMVSHNIVNSIDNKPCSLSLKIHNILRERLNFKGVIISDSLSMKAISDYEDNPYVEALLAGNNLIITEEPDITYNDIKNAYDDGIISRELLNRLVYRVIELKKDKGLI